MFFAGKPTTFDHNAAQKYFNINFKKKKKKKKKNYTTFRVVGFVCWVSFVLFFFPFGVNSLKENAEEKRVLTVALVALVADAPQIAVAHVTHRRRVVVLGLETVTSNQHHLLTEAEHKER